MDRIAAAYLRRSSADDANPGDVSREAQEAAVRALALRDGWAGELRLYVDWNRSADKAKESKRAAFLSMLGAIERDEIAVCYSYAVDRLYRSMRTYLRLIEAAAAHGTRIVTARENRELVDDSPMGIAWGQMAATFTELELNTTKARNRAATAVRVARGDKLGQPPYGKKAARVDGRIVQVDDPSRPLAPILAAYAKIGTVRGTRRALEEAKVTAPRGGKDWSDSTLTNLLDRAGVLPPRGRRRAYSHGALLAGLLVCPCGRRLTPSQSRGRPVYYCARGQAQGAAKHGKSSVAESRLLPIIRAEADRLAIPFDALELGQQDDTARESVTERKRRLSLAYVAGGLDDDIYQAELAAIVDTVSRLDAAAEVVELPPLNWDGPVAEVNAGLRSLFWPIQLNPDMTIVEIKWRAPELRAD
jgi:DNA invertase Pin-like site-specific DNA recombinase